MQRNTKADGGVNRQVDRDGRLTVTTTTTNGGGVMGGAVQEALANLGTANADAVLGVLDLSGSLDVRNLSCVRCGQKIELSHGCTLKFHNRQPHCDECFIAADVTHQLAVLLLQVDQAGLDAEAVTDAVTEGVTELLASRDIEVLDSYFEPPGDIDVPGVQWVTGSGILEQLPARSPRVLVCLFGLNARALVKGMVQDLEGLEHVDMAACCVEADTNRAAAALFPNVEFESHEERAVTTFSPA